MVTVVVYKLPAEEFALQETFEAVPGVEFQCERVVESAEDNALPLVWAREADGDELHDALAADSTVDSISRVTSAENEWLYRVEWADEVSMVLEVLLGNAAVVLDAYAAGECWRLRTLYPDHEEFSMTTEFCQTYGLTVDVERVRTMQGESTNRYGLTDDQYEALVAAWTHGYFDVPRRIDLETLADELGISHQALSERLRRGHSTLIKETLGGVAPDQRSSRHLHTELPDP